MSFKTIPDYHEKLLKEIDRILEGWYTPAEIIKEMDKTRRKIDSAVLSGKIYRQEYLGLIRATEQTLHLKLTTQPEPYKSIVLEIMQCETEDDCARIQERLNVLKNTNKYEKLARLLNSRLMTIKVFGECK